MIWLPESSSGESNAYRGGTSNGRENFARPSAPSVALGAASAFNESRKVPALPSKGACCAPARGERSLKTAPNATPAISAKINLAAEPDPRFRP